MPGAADFGSGAGGAIGAAIGYSDTAENRQKAQQDYENALAGYQGLTTQQAGPNAFNAAQIDPADRSAQLQALGKLQDIYSNQGLDAGTRAQLNQAQQSNALQAKAAQDKIQNQMQQQGLASSGSSVAAQQQAAQQASQDNYNAGTQAAALGANRQMQAIGGAAQIGGQLQGQDWQQAAQKAQAQNTINQFNAGQGNSMALAKAQGEQSAYGGMAQNQMDQAKIQQGVDAGLGQGAGGLIGAGVGALANLF